MNLKAAQAQINLGNCEHVQNNEIVRLDIKVSMEMHMLDQYAKLWSDYFQYPLSKECQAKMDGSINYLYNGRVIFKYTTNDDNCDGGNVFGLIFDYFENILVEISDGDYYCPREIDRGKRSSN